VAPVEYRIDELAQAAGTTSRNIRAHQGRGLLPPPRLVGRTGYYGEEHLRRLELIDHLQQRGFSLEAIRQTLDTWSQGGDLGHLLGLHHLLTAPFTDEEPEPVDPAELIERFPAVAEDPGLLDQALAQGLLAQGEGGDGLVAPSPILLEAGAELVRAGIPLGEILEMVKVVRADVADVAARFIELVGRNLIDPVATGSASAEEVRETAASLQRLRPIAIEVVRVFLAQEMTKAIEESLSDLAERLEADNRPPT
jgi:DNA-binding transcriptional MerR regulator